MKKRLSFIIMTLMISLMVCISACKKQDEKPPTKEITEMYGASYDMSYSEAKASLDEDDNLDFDMGSQGINDAHLIYTVRSKPSILPGGINIDCTGVGYDFVADKLETVYYTTVASYNDTLNFLKDAYGEPMEDEATFPKGLKYWKVNDLYYFLYAYSKENKASYPSPEHSYCPDDVCARIFVSPTTSFIKKHS